MYQKEGGKDGLQNIEQGLMIEEVKRSNPIKNPCSSIINLQSIHSHQSAERLPEPSAHTLKM